MTLKLYGVARSRASRMIWLAKEIGIAYEQIPVIQAYRLADATTDTRLNTSSAQFRKVNPNGLIPTIDDDGFVLHESLAITLYLAKKHGGPLAPHDLKEDALMTMWSLWAVIDCEPHALTILQQRQLLEGERDLALIEKSKTALQKPFGVLDAALAKRGGTLVGGRFTVADINCAEVFRYAQAAPELFDRFARVKAWIATCQARPAFKEMMAIRNAEPA
ncbi:MAG: glutathione S-transferase family protein [Proteobacteria bacterium]|nr:glutathione S-transferase family protein [Pseudomonadota bacterium]